MSRHPVILMLVGAVAACSLDYESGHFPTATTRCKNSDPEIDCGDAGVVRICTQSEFGGRCMDIHLLVPGHADKLHCGFDCSDPSCKEAYEEAQALCP